MSSFSCSYTSCLRVSFSFSLPSFVHFCGCAHKSDARAHTCSRLLLTFFKRRSPTSHHPPPQHPSLLASTLAVGVAPSLIRWDSAQHLSRGFWKWICKGNTSKPLCPCLNGRLERRSGRAAAEPRGQVQERGGAAPNLSGEGRGGVPRKLTQAAQRASR